MSRREKRERSSVCVCVCVCAQAGLSVYESVLESVRVIGCFCLRERERERERGLESSNAVTRGKSLKSILIGNSFPWDHWWGGSWWPNKQNSDDLPSGEKSKKTQNLHRNEPTQVHRLSWTIRMGSAKTFQRVLTVLILILQSNAHTKHFKVSCRAICGLLLFFQCQERALIF